MLSIPEIEIRILKARTATAENSLKLILKCPSIVREFEEDLNFEEDFMFSNSFIPIANISFPLQTNYMVRRMVKKTKEKFYKKKLLELENKRHLLNSLTESKGAISTSSSKMNTALPPTVRKVSTPTGNEVTRPAVKPEPKKKEYYLELAKEQGAPSKQKVSPSDYFDQVSLMARSSLL